MATVITPLTVPPVLIASESSGAPDTLYTFTSTANTWDTITATLQNGTDAVASITLTHAGVSWPQAVPAFGSVPITLRSNGGTTLTAYASTGDGSAVVFIPRGLRTVIS
jgi:hypothetical protein